MKTIPWDEIEKRHFTPQERREINAAVEAELLAMRRRAPAAPPPPARPPRREGQQ